MFKRRLNASEFVSRRLPRFECEYQEGKNGKDLENKRRLAVYRETCRNGIMSISTLIATAGRDF